MYNLKDIAKAADVSVITVSRVLNEPEKVRPATKQRVEEQLAAMAYRPNIAARNLVSGRTGVIDVYVPQSVELNNPFIMHLLVGISEVLSEWMYSFLISRSWEKSNRCDGFIVTGLLTNEINDFYAHAAEKKLPVVLFGHTGIEQIDCFDVDNTAGAAMAVNYLLENNHRVIAIINSSEVKDYAADRLAGYLGALEEAGIAVNPRLLLYGENSITGGYVAAKQLLERGEAGLSAIFCATDIMAIGVVNGLNEAGLRIPEDISIVAFDGLGFHRLTDPPLCTIRQPVFEIGKELARLIVERINGKKQRTVHFMLPELLPGGSVKRLVC
jgi:LacI family transcriptional regulator